MAIDHYRDMTLDIMGVEFEFDVEFRVYTYGSSPSYFDPGDPAELEIISVTNKLTGVDWRDKLEKMKDLDLKYHTNFKTGETNLAYGYGFQIYTNYAGKAVYIMLNKNRSLLDVLETEIHENLHEYESSYDDYGD